MNKLEVIKQLGDLKEQCNDYAPEEHKILNLTGEAKECALLGNEIVKQLFKDTSLDETIKRLDEVTNVLKIIESKNKYSITEAIGIIPYAQSYAANIKD